MLGQKKSSFWSVINGLDGCLMVPFLALILVPGMACPLLAWSTRSGSAVLANNMAAAFTPAFIQKVVTLSLLLLGGGFLLFIIMKMSTAFWASRKPEPPVIEQAAPTIYLMGSGGADLQRIMEQYQQPQLPAPTPQAPVRMAGHQVQRQWVGNAQLGIQQSQQQGQQRGGGIGWRG